MEAFFIIWYTASFPGPQRTDTLTCDAYPPIYMTGVSKEHHLHFYTLPHEILQYMFWSCTIYFFLHLHLHSVCLMGHFDLFCLSSQWLLTSRTDT